MNWYLKVLKQHYADFKGRARRKEFWMFSLFNMIICFVLGLLISILLVVSMQSFNLWLPIIGYILLVCYNLAVLVPSLAVAVRRLHDIGKSGWYFLLVLIPLAGPIILFVWFCLDSQIGENKWGVNPKEGQFDDFKKRQKYQSPNDTGVKQPTANRRHARLYCRFGNNSYTHNINTLHTSIGRERDNDLVINHATVSRHHAEIVSTDAGFEIIDKGSANKVIVNGQFFQRKMLRDGDIIGLGEVVITFIM